MQFYFFQNVIDKHKKIYYTEIVTNATIMLEKQTPGVCETLGVFYALYVRWLKPSGYCLFFLSSHLQI